MMTEYEFLATVKNQLRYKKDDLKIIAKIAYDSKEVLDYIEQLDNLIKECDIRINDIVSSFK